MSSYSVETKTVTIPADITEVILCTAKPWDDSATKVNSKSSNMTQIYSVNIAGGDMAEVRFGFIVKRKEKLRQLTLLL